jgi:hypothetical protein
VLGQIFSAWTTWNTPEEAINRIHGGETTMPTSEATVIDTTADAGKLQEAGKKRNAIAMANLTMAFTTDAGKLQEAAKQRNAIAMANLTMAFTCGRRRPP